MKIIGWGKQRPRPQPLAFEFNMMRATRIYDFNRKATISSPPSKKVITSTVIGYWELWVNVPLYLNIDWEVMISLLSYCATDKKCFENLCQGRAGKPQSCDWKILIQLSTPQLATAVALTLSIWRWRHDNDILVVSSFRSVRLRFESIIFILILL